MKAARYTLKAVENPMGAVAAFRAKHADAQVRVDERGFVVTDDIRFLDFVAKWGTDGYKKDDAPLRAGAKQLEFQAAHQPQVVNRSGLYAETEVQRRDLRASFQPPPFFPPEVQAFALTPEFQRPLTAVTHPLMLGEGPPDDGVVTLHGTNTEGFDPGHVMLSDASRGTHSSFAPRNVELAKTHALPRHPVGTLQAFPQADRDFGSFVTEGKHYGLEDDPYVYQQAKGVEAVGGKVPITQTPKAQHFAHGFDPRFLDPALFAKELELTKQREAQLAGEAAYQIATVSDNPLENPRLKPLGDPSTPEIAARLAEQKKNIEARGTNQAANCVTDLLWQLYNTPVPNAVPPRTVLTTDDLTRLGMVQRDDGGPPRFKPGQDLRPQDLFLYLRWAESDYLGSLGGT